MISLSNVTKVYQGDTYAVRDLSLDVEAGKVFVVLGESGCGKTTTLKMINRLIEPTEGVVEIEGENVLKLDPVELRRRMGYVLQGFGLFPHMTIAENIGITPKLLGWSKGDISDRVDELLEMMNLPAGTYRQRYTHELSGGQKQRISLARALAAKPKALLMDEPFGALDPITRDDLHREFKGIQESLELTVVMVTHDMTEALLMADQIIVMKDGQVVQKDTPHMLMTEPADDYVKRLMDTPKRQADQLEALSEGHAAANSNNGQ